MPRIIECVPNFSEGRNKEVIEAIANAIAHTDGCSLLDVDPGLSTNRTVYTFVGSPESVLEGAMNAARTAYQLIDMRSHQGEHPRMGAMDVCPFIPVHNTTMEECVEIAHEFGERLAVELGVPVYLYGEAAAEEKRRLLPSVRAGEYEGLVEKLEDPEWKPDFGPSDFIPSWGATAVGARKFLIAYNVNLLGTKEQAHHIALNIREQGKEKPGRLPKVQGMGWYMEEANIAQISMNLVDFEVTGIHTAYEECCNKAEELNLGIIGSQIVGIVPLKALMDAADHFMKKENLFILEEDQKVRLVINRLGLNSLGQFLPKEKIIEYMIPNDREGPLMSMDVKDFVLTIGSRSPSPGGGSVAALCGSLGAALGSMVGFLTYGNRKFHHLDTKMRELIAPLYKAMKDLLPFVDADAAAFSEYMLAVKLPNDTEEERKARETAMQSGLLTAVQVPLCVARVANTLWPTINELANFCNINCKSDLQVGVRVLETAVWGTYYNVVTNLKDIKDEELRTKMQAEIDEALTTAQQNCTAVLKVLDERKE
ncbi:formimidoyltransferase-cyclodeaminase-like [Pomacea canaliculata]|uniref:formimidoyltransferase-cyclodeaminase-like n=1 Tax=Pomacea canaliculata TaxID=400727 RepID=UPI000D734F7F|nr:formimidoyltransferase-cyclodeaminase-like [Pomacea canaliculata]